MGPGQRRLAEAVHHGVGQGETAIDFLDIAIVRRDDLPMADATKRSTGSPIRFARTRASADRDSDCAKNCGERDESAT